MSVTAPTKTTVWDFWKTNQKFWLPITAEEKSIADKIIFQTFYNYSDFFDENPIGKIIYLDQFYRHFQRVLPDGTITEKDIYQNRLKAAEILSESWALLRLVDDPLIIVWSLMPLKHLCRWKELFTTLHEVEDRFSLDSGPLSKFYQDSYKKAYTEEQISSKILTDHSDILGKYNPSEICEFHPEGLGRHSVPLTPSLFTNSTEEPSPAILTLMECFKGLREKQITVSLSGGVDSMVMLTILKHGGFNVNAVHIVYGNRAESEQEYALIATFCSHLNIPLKVYKIEWLKRSQVEREFYEKMTRDIRFMVYKAVISSSCTESIVCLGHIKEDVIENVWTNLANAQHLHNLKKMNYMEESQGVKLCRPFLDQDKEAIYEASRTFSVPYLKNTTPSWSNRGKFREHFHQAAIDQYGPEVDRKILQVADALKEQSRILDRILYQPIYKSYNQLTKTCNISSAVEAQLGASSWSVIFEHICHKILLINKPSIRCLQEFSNRIKTTHNFTMNMNKHLQVKVKTIREITVEMEFIVF